MLWYLLYPLRGTTQPPRLSANHPIRRAFYRHGKTTAQHWLVAMLVSVAIAMAFSFPTIFLAENPTAGFAAYPHHVWTTAKPFEGDPKHTDVEMRQIWVHGSYMQALDKDVLKSALSIQETLVGGEKLSNIIPALGEKLRSSTLSWGYHSPLMYWNNSARTIDEDPDIVQTINDQKRSSSSLNVALRPASVFAGKKFDRSRLQAADALVITFMNKVHDGVGGKWEDEMQTLAVGACENCTLFPSNGHVTRNRVYQFSFTPLSLQENIAFTFAYTCMALYVLLSLRRLKAFHSRFGLVVTAITQMTWSILASFTICGILKINLSMIPQNAYPFVVLVVGLENMFRLINAILAYPATMATDERIANALGDIGPVSVATAVQNFIILSLLATFVSPGVAAFCLFACIATLFDAFFLLTFFVAVLNVDIRRLELQDALARSARSHHSTKSKRRRSPLQHTWFDALLQGRLPFSTRMAGTAVTTTFILSLNYHFFEHHEKGSSLRHLLGLARGGPQSLAEADTFTPPPINATLTPGEWMEMQDFDTAREVMRLAKPGADTFVIRVFSPLIVVLAGADRTGAPLGTEAWVHALRSYAVHHFYPVAVAVVFAVAFVAVLMNFLLYSEPSESAGSESGWSEESLTVQPLHLPHKLDVVKLCGTPTGHFATIGLDKSMVISVYDKVQQTYKIISIPSELLSTMHWPVRDITLDANGDWIAYRCANEQVLVYNCATGACVQPSSPYPDDNPPVLFQFTRLPCQDGTRTHLLILTSGGRIMTFDLSNSHVNSSRLSDIPLLGAAIFDHDGLEPRLLTATEQLSIVSYTWSNSTWVLGASQSLSAVVPQHHIVGSVQVRRYEELSEDTIVIRAATSVVFLDAQTLSILNNVDLDTTGELLLQSTIECPSCGSTALTGLSVVSDRLDGNTCQLTAITAGAEGSIPLCFQNKTSSCRPTGQVHKKEHTLPDAGIWRALKSSAVLGLRRRIDPPAHNNVTGTSAGSVLLRRRGQSHQRPLHEATTDSWEAYKFSYDGDVETVDLLSSMETGGEHSQELFVNTAGPIVALDDRSVVVAFGNTVKVIRASHRSSTTQRPRGLSLKRHASVSKKRSAVRKVA